MNKATSRFSFPCVSIEQAAAFQYEKRETWTASPLVNAVIDAALNGCVMNKKALSEFLGIDPKDVTYGIHAATGMQLPVFLEEWRKERFKILLETEPTLSGKEMAAKLGFQSQGALWTFLTKHRLIQPLTHNWNLKNQLWYFRQGKKPDLTAAKKKLKEDVNKRKWELLTKKKNNNINQ